MDLDSSQRYTNQHFISELEKAYHLIEKLTWTIQHRLGVTEPIYGPSAIQSVAEQAKEKTSWSEVSKDGLKWEVMDSTNVESKTFYLVSDSGRLGLLQVIYSNVM